MTVITTRAPGSPPGAPFVGITASSFNSVSLDPPLVLWSMATRANSLPMFRDGCTTSSMCCRHRNSICASAFATLKGDRFAGVDYRLSETGLPILANALAWFRMPQPQPLRRGRPRHLRGRGGTPLPACTTARATRWCSTTAALPPPAR
ncbi:flavin reductase family protein [Cupriavidus basilensis]